MRLTNLQMNTLTNAVLKKVNQKKEEFIQTKEYEEILGKAAKELDYVKLVKLRKEKEKMTDMIAKAQDRIKDIDQEYRDIVKPANKWSILPAFEEIEKIVERRAIELASDNFPDREAIEAEIVLATIEGGDNILQRILTKFGIE